MDRVLYALTCNHHGYATVWAVFERRADAEAVAANPKASRLHDYGWQPEVEELPLFASGERPVPEAIAPAVFQHGPV